MSMSDPLGDMLARIKNGLHARKRTVTSPASRLRERVLEVLKEEGYIRGYTRTADERGLPALSIELKYDNGAPVIREMQRVSRPGRRVYSKVADMPSFYNGLGIMVVSTPHGVMADHRARSENVGGEVLCKVF